MVDVKISEETLLEMLEERIDYWTEDNAVKDLYYSMYNNYVYGGCFDGSELDIMGIVDNDYINYTTIICKSEDDFEDILKLYKENGLCDCSCKLNYSYIEAVDNEENPTMFLMRI